MSHHLSEKEVSFPHIVSVHGISVKIYRGKNNGYSSFFVHWHDAGGRRCKRCATFEKAQDEADIAIQVLLRGQTEVLNLTNDDRLTYLRSQEYLKPFSVRLDQACTEYAEVRKHLGNTSLIEAVKFYVEHRPDRFPAKTVKEVVAELLNARERDGCSKIYLSWLPATLQTSVEQHLYTNGRVAQESLGWEHLCELFGADPMSEFSLGFIPR